jgi:hypothetical protein
MVVGEVDQDQVAQRRAALPLRQQKRHDLYELLDKRPA